MNNGEDWTKETLLAAEEAIGYSFRDKQLLKTCFTHSSYSNLYKVESNERLEFLGDSVLGLCISEQLFEENGGDEGKLTELRKQYVSATALEQAVERAGLMKFLRYSGGEHNLGKKAVSSLFEAVVAGIYLDGGMEAAKRFIARHLNKTETEDYKSLLQNFVQEQTKTTPVYEKVREEEGTFVCRVRALGLVGEGEGESIKAAETGAAKALYQKLAERKSK